MDLDLYSDEDYEFSMSSMQDEYSMLTSQDDFYETSDGFMELVKHCLIPNLKGVGYHVAHILASCLIFRLVSQTVSLPMNVRHMASVACGLYALVYFFESLVVDLLILVVITYFMLSALHAVKMKRGPIISLLSFAYLIGNEFFLEPESWQKIRGAEMLVVMKVVSVSFDLDSGTLMRLPNICEYSGYILCPGTSVFGVWTSIQDYYNIFQSPVWNIWWVVGATRSLLLSLVSFILTACVVEWLIYPESALWRVLYCDALQFRTSHYFVSYLSETTAILSGFGVLQDGHWSVSVSEPRHIELPHSLVEVVIYWNKYMHKWLKLYVFKTSSQFGGPVAILTTYTVSSLLHGLHYPLATILLSLGMYTFVEHTVRQWLSVVASACVASRPCPTPCTRHKRSTQRLAVALCNWCWSALAIFHLAYLGCIMDTSQASPPSFPAAFKKWKDVYYISHVVAILTYLLYFCVR